MAGKSYPLKVIISAVDRISGPMRAIGARLKGFQQSISNRLGMAEFTRGMRRAGDSLGRAGQQFGSIARMASRAALAVAAVGTAAAFSIKSFADYASEFQDLSDQTGINAEALQAWSFGAQQAGVSAEQFAQAVRILSKNLGEAKLGKGPGLPVFKAIIGGANLAKATVETALPAIAEKLSKMKDSSMQAAAAARLFGRGGVVLLPFLKSGAAGLAEFTRRAAELGVTLSADTVKSGEAFGDQISEIGLAVRGVRNQIVGAMIPALSALGTELTNSIINNLPQIREWATQFGKGLPDRIRNLRTSLADMRGALDPVIKLLSWLSDNFGLVNIAVVALSLVIATKLVIGVAALSSALATLGITMLATPVGWLLLGVAALAAGALVLYRNWDKVAKWWAGVVESIKQTVENLAYAFKLMNPFGWLADSAKSAGEAISRYIPDWMRSAGKTLGRLDRYPSAAAAAQGATKGGEVKVTVDFSKIPKGTEVKTTTSGAPNYSVNQGYATGHW